jgi:Tfp pilus assembly protein PilV
MAANRVNPRPQGGFTLVEVMIAILLTALTVIGVVALFRVETRASAYSRRETEASVLAQDTLEKQRTFAAPTASSTTTETALDALGRDTTTTGTTVGHVFTRTVTLAPTTDTSVYKITVTISWTDESGVSRSVTVNGMRAAG